MIDKVAIVGCYPTRAEAPFDDDSFDIWTLNGDIRTYEEEHVHTWFDLHDWDIANYEPEYLDEIPDKPQFDIVNMDNFPYTTLSKRYGYFWENSIPMMMAYAGLQGYHYIYLFGLSEGGEFADNPQMVHNLFHVMGALRAEGRRVYLVNYSRLDTHDFYGYKDLQKTRIPVGFRFKEG